MISRRIFAALAALCLGWLILGGSVAHANCTAPCTKTQISTDITTNWPDNTIGSITPALLRSTVLDLLNSYLDVNGSSSFACTTHQFLTAIATLSSYTCAQPAASDLSNGVTGTGLVVLNNGPTFLGTVTGGTAAGSSLTLESTSNGSPSGDVLTLAASTIKLIPTAGGAGNVTVDVGVANATSGVITIAGGSSGAQTWKPALAASGTITFPAGTVDFSGTGGTSQVVKQTSSGGSFTVGQLACADLSNAAASCPIDATNASNIGSGTLPIARLPVNPNFRVHLVGNQSISASTYTKVLYDTVDIDSNSFWSATNHNYLPTIAGTYQFCASGYASATYALGSLIILQFSKNGLHGTGTEQGSGLTLTGGANSSEGVTAACTVVAMNGSTDTMEVDMDNTGTSPSITGSTTASVIANYFTGKRISP